MQERRRVPRVVGPFDATWSGASGGHPCRLPDISAAGCYVSTLSTQAIGAEVFVTLQGALGDKLVLQGRVVSSDVGFGFGVEFVDLSAEQQEALGAWLHAHAT